MIVQKYSDLYTNIGKISQVFLKCLLRIRSIEQMRREAKFKRMREWGI